MTVDILVCHPKDLIYSQFIKQINDNRDLFGRVIVVMTQSDSDRNYTNYLKITIKRATIVGKYKDRGRDWRNAAVNEGLKYLVSDSVLFLEQDFLVEEGFFEKLLEEGEKHSVIGFDGGNRFHPACLLVKRDILNRTSKDFSVDRNVGDHFVKFSKELMSLGNWVDLKELNLPEWKHLAGLSQNYRLTKNFYQPKDFYKYLQESLLYDNLPDDWIEFTKKKLKEVKKEI